MIADAVGDVIAVILGLTGGAHPVGIEALVVGLDDGVGLHFLPHLRRRVDSAGDDGISIAGALNV